MGSHVDIDFSVSKIHTVVERAPNPQWKMETGMNREHCVLCAALEGEAFYTFGEKQEETFCAKQGDTMLFLPNQPRSARSDPQAPWRFISTVFDVEINNTYTGQLLYELPYVLHDSPQMMFASFNELNHIWSGKRTAYMVKCRALIESIICDWILLHHASADAMHYQKIEAVRQYIQENFSSFFSVEELARQTNLSPSHFRALFKKIVGMTTTQYAAVVRIGKAKDMLLSGEMNVSEAAQYAGYRDVFYFSRQFKAITGHAPSDFIP